MLPKSVFVRGFSFAATAAAIVLSGAPAQAHQALQRFSQAEQRGPNGRIAVEASVITVIGCNSPGERGGQYYIYQYVNRPGFRAILPPNWGQPLGGRDWATYEQAAYAACVGVAVAPPAPPPTPPVQAAPGPFAGRWKGYGSNEWLYDVNHTGNNFTWARLNTNEIGQGTVNGDRINAQWTGGGTATGTITARNAAGYATRVEWTNGAFWTR